jgi:SNF2 family DNA or RNA helicase
MSSFTISAASVWPDVLEQVPNDIQLFPHQIDSVKWLLERENNGNKSNLYGDIMGLGKTIATVTLLSLRIVERTLVICPKSLICQWARELVLQEHTVYFIESSFSHRISVDSESGKVIFHQKKTKHKNMRIPFVAITSYGKVKPFPEPKHAEETKISVFACASSIPEKTLIPFRHITWNRIVVDEVHNLRNGVSLKGDASAQLRKKSLRFYRLLRLRKIKSTMMLGLTGTPIQNRIGDLASIFLFLGCSIGRMTSQEDLEALIMTNMFRRNVSNLTDLTKVIIMFPTEPYNAVKAMVKYETVEEKNFYLATAGNLSERLKAVLGGYEELVSEDNILLLFTLLRLLSSHPTSFINCYNKRYENQIPEWTGIVSKLNMIEAQLANYHSEGESCIVFVHFYEEAGQIAQLETGYKNIEFINGTVNMEDRDHVANDSKRIIEKGGTFLIIANIISCGEGLNLQHFHNIIIATPDWNPQAEEQAIGRVYRIGSPRPVNVTRYYHEAIEDLAATLNIDKYMKTKQKLKRKIAKEIIDETPNAAWNYPITMIPDYNVPCTTFPLIQKVDKQRKFITKPPNKKINNALPQDRKARTDLVAEVTTKRLGL